MAIHVSNFPIVLVAAALVGAADNPLLTALAMVATCVGGFLILRNRTNLGEN